MFNLQYHSIILLSLYIFIILTDDARVVRETNDDESLSRHRRELAQEMMDEEDKPKARSKVIFYFLCYF